MSLSQDPAYSALKNHFVCGFTDITNTSYSGMSGKHTTFGNAVNTTNGAGPKNLQLFMLSTDGTVLHCLPGYWNSRDLVYEMVFAAQLDEIYKDKTLSASQKTARFQKMQLAHFKLHPKQMSARSRMQGFDQKYEAEHKLDSSDTIKDKQLVRVSLKNGSHIPSQAFKTTDQIMHERMATRPFLHYTRFDVAKYSDYGKPVYDKNEDQRDYRTGETIVENGKKEMIGNPVAMAKQKYGKKWRDHVADPDQVKGWGEGVQNSSQAAWTGNGQSQGGTWGNAQSSGSQWGIPPEKHHNQNKRGKN